MPANLTAHDEIRWVDPNELLSFELAPADLEIAHLLQKEACSAKKAPE